MTMNRRASGLDVLSVIQAMPDIRESCGNCTVRHEGFGPVLPGFCHLSITMCEEVTRTELSQTLRSLDVVLESVLKSPMPFVATLDFHVDPPEQIAELLALFFKKHRECMRDRLKGIALVIEENIFSAVARGCTLCWFKTSFPWCPSLICHGEASAQEFFKWNVGSEASTSNLSSFVSVADVLDATCDGNRTASRSILASLRPLLRRPDSVGHLVPQLNGAAPTLHSLPNGDVRVIQSPPRDVIVADDGNELRGSSKESTPGLPQTVALKFQCSRARLAQLQGSHFHIGELLIDAEYESANRMQRREESCLNCNCNCNCCFCVFMFMIDTAFERMLAKLDMFGSSASFRSRSAEQL